MTHLVADLERAPGQCANRSSRNVLTPNDLYSLAELIERIHVFGERYSALDKPFAWTFTRHDLERRLRDPLLQLEPPTSLLTAA